MERPQQEELARTGYVPQDQDSWSIKAKESGLEEKGPRGTVPPENRPGHHPDAEQDKPEELGGAGHGGSGS